MLNLSERITIFRKSPKSAKWWRHQLAWMGGAGVKPGNVAVFWLGIQIPPSKFMPSPDGPMATFVLREHASIPEPATPALVAFAGGMTLGSRFRRG